MYAALVTSLVLAAGAAPEPQTWLESELRRRYTSVTQWRIREVLPMRATDGWRAESFEVGPLGSRTLVLVHGRDANGRPAVARRWYEVSGFSTGVVVTRTLGALTTVTPEMVAETAIDVMAQPCAPLNSGAAAVGMRLLQSRHEGEVLCTSMLGVVPAVARGKTITVEVTAGAVVLRTEAVARADAGLGERVSLYRASNSAPFWGVVTGPGEVRVNE